MELAHELTQRGHEITVVACAQEGQAGESLQDGNRVLRVDWKKEPRPQSNIANCLPRSRLMMNLNLALWKGFLKVAKKEHFDVVDVVGTSAENLIPCLYDEAPVLSSNWLGQPNFIAKELSVIGQSAFQFETAIKDVLASIKSGFTSETEGQDTACSYVVDTDCFKPDVEKGVDTKGRPTILIYTSIGVESSQKLLADIFSHVKAAVPDVFMLVIAHDIYSESSEGELKKVLSASGIECDMVINRNMSKLILSNLWSSADCGVLIDWYDFSPQALLEPLACGKAVVANLSGVDSGFLKDKSVVSSLEDFKGEAIAKKLVELLKKDGVASTIGQKARQYILQNHCRKQMAENRLVSYNSAIKAYSSQSKREKKIGRLEKLLEYLAMLSDALDQMVYDLLFLSSTRFKVSHWLRKLKGKPGSKPADTISK